MNTQRIQVDTTLPPQQFHTALIREAKRVREERRLIRMWEQIRERRIQTAQQAFERMGWTPEMARQMAESNVSGLPA